ncbi:MAG: serine hydrolase [Proteobacteria bacterium]|nr:serine hydrolase [Pseudomonadota bacterium]MBI3498077.1 serine hydrolase [Pseudomonadota bacterium]
MSSPYHPGPGADWAKADPASAGFDPEGLEAAIDYAKTHETSWSRDIRSQLIAGLFEPPPYNEIIGPVEPRGGPNGIVLKGGRIVAEWGETNRADMTFSAAKSYISLTAGLAVDRGLIPSIDAPVRDLVRDGGFEPPHNHAITWRHLLTLTSEWEGTLWDKPDLIDRNRNLATEGGSALKGKHRDLKPPGRYWEYNDVRVNRLALALLRVWRRPLPEVLKEKVMDPIGASSDWRWHGYRNSTVEIDGQPMQSVSGGGHWGGGMFISSRDHARVGLLMARSGLWQGRRLISDAWIQSSLEPSPLNPSYGLMWWLNGPGQQWPSAPRSSFAAVGAGQNLLWVDPEHDLVAVVRWIDKAHADGFLARLLGALRLSAVGRVSAA